MAFFLAHRATLAAASVAPALVGRNGALCRHAVGKATARRSREWCWRCRASIGTPIYQAQKTGGNNASEIPSATEGSRSGPSSKARRAKGEFSEGSFKEYVRIDDEREGAGGDGFFKAQRKAGAQITLLEVARIAPHSARALKKKCSSQFSCC
jgi:hypothetical protein